MSAPRWLRGLLAFWTALAVLALSVGVSPAVAAPDIGPQLQESSPKNASAGTTRPEGIVLTFDRDIVEGTMKLSNPRGDVPLADVAASGPTLKAALPADAPAGDYRLTYTAKSASGPEVEGSLQFSFTTGTVPTTGAPTADPSTPGDTTTPSSGGATGTDAPTTPGTTATRPGTATPEGGQGGVPNVIWVVAGLLVLGLALLVTLNMQSRQKSAARKSAAAKDPDHL